MIQPISIQHLAASGALQIDSGEFKGQHFGWLNYAGNGQYRVTTESIPQQSELEYETRYYEDALHFAMALAYMYITYKNEERRKLLESQQQREPLPDR